MTALLLYSSSTQRMLKFVGSVIRISYNTSSIVGQSATSNEISQTATIKTVSKSSLRINVFSQPQLFFPDKSSIFTHFWQFHVHTFVNTNDLVKRHFLYFFFITVWNLDFRMFKQNLDNRMAYTVIK